jgi:oligopeptide/dipeptide ABC transporter ATP-binding protein
MARLLSVRDLEVWFSVRTGLLSGLARKEEKHVRAVDGVSFEVERGEVFCLVGESGCGKTTSGKAILRLNEATGGHVLFDVPEKDWDLLDAIDRRIDALRPTLPAPTPEEEARLAPLWWWLQALKTMTIERLHPWARVSTRTRRGGLERQRQFLEQRLADIEAGTDAMVRRTIQKRRREIEILREKGPWFTARRAHALDVAQAGIKEAEYRLRRAEASGFGVRKGRRRVHRAERRVNRLLRHAAPGTPEAQARIGELERTAAEEESLVVERERSNIRAEHARVLEQLEELRKAEAIEGSALAAELRWIGDRLDRVRRQGGPRLELWELLQLRTDIIAQHDLTRWSPERVRELRRRMQIIYQDPYESLNPKLSIFDIVSEPLFANKVVQTSGDAEILVRKALEDVGLRPADEFMFRFPHELSGGQRQRVGVATALVVDPEFIVADEPVSMLDASVRTEILALLLDLKKRRNLTYLFITHDLSLAWIIADHVAVMYLGKVVEIGDGPEIIQNPRHPYTKALISVVPSPNPTVEREKIILRGERPNPVDIPAGCRFHPRCPVAVGICGWTAEEVQDELTHLVEEDAAKHPEAGAFGEIRPAGPFRLEVASTDGESSARYLRSRVEALGSTRPALAAIRRIEPDGGVLRIQLHEPVEPPLRPIREGVSVACHLVEPELEPVVPEGPAAVPGGQSLPSTSPIAR